MRSDEKVEFCDLVTNVMAYYGRDTSTFMLDVFWNGLTRYEFVDVRRAFDVHAQDPDHGQFAPRVADITRLLEGSTQTQGMRAWATVLRAIQSVGQYQSVVFDDPLIHAVIDGMGGWVALCRTAIDELPFRARDFERSYAAYRLRREIPEYPAKLTGLCEKENRMLCQAVAPPILIGDPARACAVLERGAAGSTLRITQHVADAVARIGGAQA